jgi:hypothetical protein
MLIKDTLMLFNKLGKEFNWKWSLKRIKEEHDSAAMEVNKRRFSAHKFCKPETYGNFTKLTSQLEVAQEGQVMHHCVSSYASYCSNDTYQVWAYDDGKERGTLGLDTYRVPMLAVWDKGVKVSFNQFYGVVNSRMSDKAHAEAKELIQILNKDSSNG